VAIIVVLAVSRALLMVQLANAKIAAARPQASGPLPIARDLHVDHGGVPPVSFGCACKDQDAKSLFENSSTLKIRGECPISMILAF